MGVNNVQSKQQDRGLEMVLQTKMSSECPSCSRAVYAAEEKIAGGFRWHKACFKCCNKSCNKRLDSTLCAEHDGKLYCKTCYGRLHGPKGYGFGGGAGTLNTDSGNQIESEEKEKIQNGHSKPSSKGAACPQGKGCPRCSCYVYHADQVKNRNDLEISLALSLKRI